MTAYACWPFCNFKSSTASFVIDAVTTVPATSMRTCAVVCPFSTSTIVPFSIFRAMSFISLSILPALPCSFEQGIKLRIRHIDLIEYLVEVARVIVNVAWKLVRKEQTGKPPKPVWQAWTQENAAPLHSFDVRP